MMGITLSTRVGRLSETHSDNCIQLTIVNSVPQGKEWLNGDARSPINCRCLNKWFVRICRLATAADETAAQLLEKSRFGGSIVNHHGNKTGNWTACAKVVWQVHTKASFGASPPAT